jgi:enoyl-CoA hydratase/carnithine racemase
VTGALVQTEDAGYVRTLTLNSPHNRNALSSQLLEELAEGLRTAETDEAVRLVVITGHGTVFCSGADLSERPGAVASRMPEILANIRSARVPVVAKVNGHARAGGLGLIAAADLSVAAASSTFAFTEVRVGVAPAMILVPAQHVMDRRFMANKMLTGDAFSATEAAAAGLLTAVVDEPDDLSKWVDAVVTSVLKSAPGAVAATKALLGDLPERSWAEGLQIAQTKSAELFGGAEASEGMEAFLNKRTPSWDVSDA